MATKTKATKTLTRKAAPAPKARKPVPTIRERVLAALTKNRKQRSASELTEMLECSSASVSKALRELLGEGQITMIREGRYVNYKLA